MRKIFTLFTFLSATFLTSFSQNDTNINEMPAAVAFIQSSAETFPINLTIFVASQSKNNKVNINWTVDNNETANYFELEKSINGKRFATAAIIFCSEKNGTENYMFYETNKDKDNVSYRLKMIDKKQIVELSETIFIKK